MSQDELDARTARAVESLNLAERVLPGLLTTLTGLVRWRRQTLRAAGVDPAEFAGERMTGHPERWKAFDAAMAKGRRRLARRKHPMDRPDAWPPYLWEPGDRFACATCGEPIVIGPAGPESDGGTCRHVPALVHLDPLDGS